MNLTCIMCPIGCQISATKTADGYAIVGNTCKRGEVYAVQELTAPKRVITALFTLSTGEVVPCKTNGVVDKKLIFGILKEIQKATKTPPVAIGDVLIKDVLATGVDIVATADKP